MPSKEFREAVEAEYETVIQQIHEAIVYVDTLQVLLRRPLVGRKQAQILAANGGRVRNYTREPPNSRYPRRLLIQRPTRAALKLLQKFAPDHRVNRFDVALDLTVRDQGALDLLDDFFKQYITHPWHVRRRMHEIGSVRYYAGDRSSNRNLVIYSDRRSKITGALCMHLEPRIGTTSGCSRYGVNHVLDLFQLDIPGFLRRQMRLEAVDPDCLSRVIERRARGTLRAKRKLEDELARVGRRQGREPSPKHWRLSDCRELERQKLAEALTTEGFAPRPDRLEFEKYCVQRLKEQYGRAVNRCLFAIDLDPLIPASNDLLWLNDESGAP